MPSRRCRIRDLSLERHLPMREQHYQTIMSNISNGRVKPTQPPTVPQDYYGTIKNRLSSGRMILSKGYQSQKKAIINILLIIMRSIDE